ncbi:hypothetical protein CVIRNUC_010294 [Coccomyxa viridis]|uniref:Uncharacterized protein n=1 Tax=Coccomyxa viridis TaxID=1274662 RepID=A0AAV1IM71_9CHLO|nr:hypothetical protein CVIRNUC_010294 [Coccomyxa viridis]
MSFGEEKLVQGSEQTGSISSILLHALQRVTLAGLRLTGVLIHLVNRTVADVRRALWWQERTARHRYMLKLAAENERQRMQAHSVPRRQSEPVRRDAGDAQFLKMLHSMDDASIPLEKKWEAISLQMSSKEEFRKQLSRLFELAGESSSAVQGLASSPDRFWKSAHTQSVIAQEKALKRHLFTQMLEAGASPA